jgi:hypothetical protein
MKGKRRGQPGSETAMKRKPKRTVAGKPPRNPHARALGGALFKPKVVKKKDAYVRKPRHRKQMKHEVEGEG